MRKKSEAAEAEEEQLVMLEAAMEALSGEVERNPKNDAQSDSSDPAHPDS